MDEIALLQAQLAAVQQQESALKLSDHNVIDLLTKLQQLGKIHFVHTLTGKQILTPKQVEREIEDHVSLNGGRISLSELQQLLSIDRSYVEKHMGQLVRANRNASGPNASQYFVVNNGEEVLTNWYLDAIMEDANTLLQESGTTTIGELAQQFGFAVEYMKEVVLSRLGTILKAQERGNVLYTHSFVERQRAQIRGVFAAITRPTYVPDLVRSYRFDEKVVDDYLPELITKPVLMGTLRGREYVPYVFIDAQRESMYSFFQQNGYLDHARAQQLQVSRPYDFLKKRFPDAVALKDCVVSHALQMQLEGSIEVAVNDASYVDVRTILPSAIHEVDASILLAKSPLVAARGTGGDAVQIADVYAVSKALLAASLQVLQKDAATKAQRASTALQQQRTSPPVAKEEAAATGDLDQDDDGDDGSGKRGRKGKKNNSQTATAPPVEDRKVTSAKSKKDKGGKRGKKAAMEDDDDGGEDVAAASAKRGGRGGGRQDPSSVSITPSQDETQELLSRVFPQTEDDEDLLAHVAEHLASDISKIYSSALTTALSSVHRGDAISLRDVRKKFEDQFDELVVALAIYEKGYNKLEIHVDAKDAAAMDQLKRVEIHLLETIGAEIATLVTTYVAVSHTIDLEDAPSFESLLPPTATAAADVADHNGKPTTKMMASLSEANKKILENDLPNATASALVRLWTFTTAGRRSLGDFTSQLPVVANALSVPLRKMDRKRERQILFAYRHAVVAALDTAVGHDDYASTAALVIQLFFQQTTGLPGSFPRDTIETSEMVLRAFSAGVPEAAAERLREFVVLAKRLSEAHAGGGDDDAAAARWPAVVEDVKALVLAKDLNAAITEGVAAANE